MNSRVPPTGCLKKKTLEDLENRWRRMRGQRPRVTTRPVPGPLLLSLAFSLWFAGPVPSLALHFLPVLWSCWRLRPEGSPGHPCKALTLEVALCFLQEQIPVLLGRKVGRSAPGHYQQLQLHQRVCMSDGVLASFPALEKLRPLLGNSEQEQGVRTLLPPPSGWHFGV